MQHQIIMENWRRFLDQPEPSPYLIYERKGTIQRVNFNNLLTELDNGTITQQQAYLIFEQAFDHGMKQLLEEGVLDLLKKIPGVDKLGKLAGQAGDKIRAAWKKVSDFYLDMVLKGMQLASKGATTFVKYFNKIFSAIDKFKEKHPIFYKIIVGIIFAVLIYSIFGSSNAQAAVKVGNYTLDDQTYQAMQGALDLASRGEPDLVMTIGKAQVALERAHQAKEAVNIETLGPIVDEALIQVVDAMGKIKQGGEEGEVNLNLFARWIDIGKSLRFETVGF